LRVPSKTVGLAQTAEEASGESLEGQPWKQDVTRPSWLPNAEERVSIFSYFKARSAPIEGLPCGVEEKGTEEKWEVGSSLSHAASSQLEANKSDAVAVPAAAEPGFETFTAQSLEEMAVQELGLGTPRVAVPDGSVQGPSTSAIYHVLEDISISESPSAMVRKFIHATRSQKPPPGADPQQRSEFPGDATFKQPLTAAPRSKKATTSRDCRAEVEEAPSKPALARHLPPGESSRNADPAPSAAPTDFAAPIRPPRRFGGGCAKDAGPVATCDRLDVEVVSKGAASSSLGLFHDDDGSARCSALSSGYYGQATPSGSRRSQESQPRHDDDEVKMPLQRARLKRSVRIQTLSELVPFVPAPTDLVTRNRTRSFKVCCSMAHSGASNASDGDPLQSTLAAVQNFRLPPFWPKNPTVWLMQVEAQFRLRHITSQETRYLHTVSSLPADVAEELADILAAPDPVNPFDQLKAAILDRKTESERSRLQQLLNTEELGDRRPSQLLHRMRQLLGAQNPDLNNHLLLAVIGGPLQRPEVSLGHVCVGVPVPLVLTLVNLSAAAVADAEQSAVRVDLPSPVTLEGGRTTEVQGTFLSREAGEVLAEVDVEEAPVSGPGQASRLSLGRCCVLVRASAEVPQVSLEPRGGLRWDALPWASGKHSRRLIVTNCGTCPVPVRITVCQGEGLFSLSALRDESGRCTEAPSVCCVLPGKGQGQVAEFEVTCSTEHATCLSVDARVEVTLEGASVPGVPLATMTLSATLLPPPLVVQGDGPLVVEGGGSKVVRVVNQGNGPLDVEFRATTPFRVSPDRAVLGPSLGASLRLSLADGAADCTGVLEGLLRPRGPRLDLAQLRGVPGTRALPHRCPLEATRRTLFWPGTQVGCSTCVAPVPCLTVDRHARVVAGATTCCGTSLVSVQGGGRSASLAPGSSLEVGVTFRPTRVGFAQSRLTVASRSSTSAENKSVQLYGFGGELCLRLSGLHPAGPPLHVLDMGMPLPEGATASRQIGLTNDGRWDCCVCLALDAAAREGPYGRLAVTPERLVLRGNESKVVSVSFRFGGRGLDQRGEIVNLGTLRILYGFEALRQHARRKLGGRPDAASPSPDVSLLLRTCEGEQNGTDDGVCIPAGALPEALLKTTSQAVVAVTCGPRPGRLQDSAVAASFAALEDTASKEFLADGVCIPAGALPEALLKTTSQAVVAVTCGPRPGDCRIRPWPPLSPPSRTPDGVCIPAGALPEALLKTTSQAVVAVTCGPRPGRLQDSAVAASFAALEDTSRQPFQAYQPDNWLLPSLIDGGNIFSEEEGRERNKRRCAQQREWFRNRLGAAVA
ncbi:hypothetical protein HPB47_024784, partial [Ixodes persulcatus]